MVDLIPKEARKTGEGKGSVLVKKGCEIVRWFISSYSCFFLSFTTSLTVPSQLLFFFLLKLFVQSFLWKAYTYVTRILRFRCLSEAATRIPPSTLTTFANSHLSHCLRLAFVLQSTRRASKNDLGWRRTKVRARTNQTQLSNGNKDHRMRPWHQWYNAIPRPTLYFCVLSLFFFYFFGLTFVRLLLFTLLPALFFPRRCDCVIPAFIFSSGWRCSSRLSGLFDFLVLALICSDTSPTRYFRIFFLLVLFSTSSVEPSLLFQSNLFFHSAASTYHCSFPLFFSPL